MIVKRPSCQLKSTDYMTAIQRISGLFSSFSQKVGKVRLRKPSEPALGDDEINDGVGAVATFEIAEDEGAFAAHPACVAIHDFEAGAAHRGEIDLVDDEEV